MLRRIKTLLFQFWCKIRFYGHPVEYARYLGVRIGEDCVIYPDPKNLFSTEPFLITIGNHVMITNGVKFLTHDGAAFTLAYRHDKNHKKYFDIWGPISIGNNVYIGTNALILSNVTVCDNVIIAAGAVVSKDIDEDGVWAGVPAKRIKSFAEYKENANLELVDNSGLSFLQRKEKYKALHPEWFSQ